MKKQTIEEWRKEGTDRFGGFNKLTFICPKCSRTSTANDFVIAGVELNEALQSAPQECISRYSEKHGCDWVSYGLFGTLGKGRIVVFPDGNEVEVFDFADNDK